jgi:hypothetical protein
MNNLLNFSIMDVNTLLQTLQTPLHPNKKKALYSQLEEYINYLITNDFQRLVQLLYTVDVNEQKLKIVLQQQPERDAAAVITELLVQRQEEKAQTRQQFKEGWQGPEEERW